MLINDILELSKIETGRLELQLAPVDLRMLFGAVMAAVRLRTDPGKIELQLQCDDAPVVVVADGAKLRQVLFNLLSNAVKFSGGGKVTLAVQPLAGADANQQRLRFAVNDTGPGIAAPDQEQIFQPFVQADTPATQAGTGLGLTISREFVRLMGGELEVDSTVGTGSTFWFVLDVEPCVAPPAPSQAESLLDAVDEPGALARQPAVLSLDDLDGNTELQALPPRQRAALKDAVAKLDLAGVEELIAEIERQQPTAAARVRCMVAAARYPQLWELLD